MTDTLLEGIDWILRQCTLACIARALCAERGYVTPLIRIYDVHVGALGGVIMSCNHR